MADPRPVPLGWVHVQLSVSRLVLECQTRPADGRTVTQRLRSSSKHKAEVLCPVPHTVAVFARLALGEASENSKTAPPTTPRVSRIIACWLIRQHRKVAAWRSNEVVQMADSTRTPSACSSIPFGPIRRLIKPKLESFQVGKPQHCRAGSRMYSFVGCETDRQLKTEQATGVFSIAPSWAQPRACALRMRFGLCDPIFLAIYEAAARHFHP